MTSAQVAREFTRLKDLQRLLRFYERNYSPPYGTACLRRDVVEQMRKLAKLMAYGAPATLLLVPMLLALLPSAAMARDDGRYAQSPLKDWVRGLKDKNGAGCCDTADGFPAEVEWDTKANRYRVRIEGAWYDVPDSAVLTQPNRLGYPMVWYWFKDGVPQIRCFIAGSAG